MKGKSTVKAEAKKKAAAAPPCGVCATWSELALDHRILEAFKPLRWDAPTPVQSACIPLALKGRDLALHFHTGSGKTGAFLIPILQRIITENEQMRNRRAAKNPLALLIVPSVELCEQTVEVANALAKYIRPRIVVDNLTSRGSITKARIVSAPILVTTAALLGKHCRSGVVTAEDLQFLRCVVIDEADMMMSIAESSVRAVQSVLPSSTQVILASATLTNGVTHIKGQLLRNPVTITLSTEDGDRKSLKEGGVSGGRPGDDTLVVESRVAVRGGGDAAEKLQHYYLVATDECHHHTLLYSLYRLGHIKGKTLIFVNTEDATYKLHSFLVQLGVDAVAYDSNLPLNVRMDALHRFQVGSVATLICTDGTLESVDRLQTDVGEDEKMQQKGLSVNAASPTGDRGGRGEMKRNNIGALHRGIDFSDVRNVILFDGIGPPTNAAFSRYTHRVGRAGRGGKGGMAITLLTVQQAQRVTKHLRHYLSGTHNPLEPFKQLKRQEAAKLQYRVDNVLASITRSSTRRQRIAAVASELTRSAYLTSHMNGKESAVLQRILSRTKKLTKCDSSLVEVPHYMSIQGADSAENYRKRVRAKALSVSSPSKKVQKRPRDPLSGVANAVKQNALKKRRV